MFLKNKSIKTRIIFMSFLIMIITVCSIMLTEYLLQQNMTAIAIDMGKVTAPPPDVNSSKDNAVIIKAAEDQFEALQQKKFIRLVSISALLLSIGLFLIYKVLRHELRPLKTLEKNMEEVDFQNRNLPLPVSKSQSSEIISLTDSYNNMISKLKKSYDLQKRFSQNAAHELKTPITTMKASLQVYKLMPYGKDEETQSLISTLEDQTLRMEALIHSLLLLNNKNGVQLQIVSLKQLLEECLLTFNERMQEKEIQIDFSGQASIKTDLTVMSIILKNLIENAIRYNKQNGQIRFNLTPSYLEITDTGMGISEEEQERIFSPFYSVDPSRSKEFGGFGLGLSIVKEGIERLGLQIEVTSKLEEGTTFKIIY